MLNSFDVAKWRERTKSDDYAESYQYYYEQLKDNAAKEKSKEEKELEEFWRSFNSRQDATWAVSAIYGLLQGWGMAGFVLYMIKNVKLEEEAEWAIATSIALTVAMVNTWLVRPDLEKYVAFKEYKELLEGKKISPWAITLAGLSALLFGGIVAYGISGSLGTDDKRVVGPIFGIVALVLATAEGFLCIGGLDKILKTGLKKKVDDLFDEYEDKNQKFNAKVTFASVIVASCIGMIGIALVGSKALANQVLGDTDSTNISITSTILLLVSLAQIPFYIDRAEMLTKRWVPVPAREETSTLLTNDSATDEEKKQKDKLIFNPDSTAQGMAQKSLWVGNAFFNAPGAYIGVTTILGKCLGLQKIYGKLDADEHRSKFEAQNTFEQIFFQYGMSIETGIIYGVATLFFCTAVVISLSANSKQPTKMADPENEYHRTKMGMN